MCAHLSEEEQVSLTVTLSHTESRVHLRAHLIEVTAKAWRGKSIIQGQNSVDQVLATALVLSANNPNGWLSCAQWQVGRSAGRQVGDPHSFPFGWTPTPPPMPAD